MSPALVSRLIHPIEEESYAILRMRADTAALAPLTRAVTERVVHASADLDYLTDLVCAEEALDAGAAALRRGGPGGGGQRDGVGRHHQPRGRLPGTGYSAGPVAGRPGGGSPARPRGPASRAGERLAPAPCG